jgi:hypothetical protein
MPYMTWGLLRCKDLSGLGATVLMTALLCCCLLHCDVPCCAVLCRAVLAQELYVDHNKLQTLPLSLTKLTNLRRL